MRIADCIIVGAPKTGTTSLYRYLEGHPDVFEPSDVKEIHYFGSDLKFLNHDVSDELYNSYFEGAGDRVAVEASVWYLYSQKAAEEIYKANSKAKIIIMLREPIDMLISLQKHNFYERNDDQEDFWKSLELEEKRKKGECVPEAAYFPQGLFYREIVSYFEQVKRYIDVFGEENVHVILYDDFKKDTAGEFKKVLQFLGIDESYEPEFVVHNPKKTLRFAILQDFMLKPPDKVRKIVRFFLNEKLVGKVVKFVTKLNTLRRKKMELDKDKENELKKYFEKDVGKLEKIIGRDLSFWKK